MTTATSTILLSSPQFNAINASLHSIAFSLQNQSFLNTQLFAAVVGAALGLMPSLYLLYKDRPRIKVKVGHILVPIPSISHIDNGFSVAISNSGRRPITVERIFLPFKDGESLVFTSESSFVGGSSGLPKVLGEGNSHNVAVLAGEVAEAFLRKQSYPVAACYGDALGNVYKCKTTQEFWDTMFRVQASDSN
ncbi:MAG: hypothetical protein ABSB00_01910 [Minisyncoccia bacterium]|jgi:hypothetical protein